MNRFFAAPVLLFLIFLGGCLGGGNDAPAPVTFYGASSGAGSAGMHTVDAGETLWDISQRYNLSMRDIIHENELSAPYILDVGQHLKLPPPRQYKVKRGDTLYGISRLFNVGVNEIARLNNMSSPYTLNAGQVLRLPSAGRKAYSDEPERTEVASASAPAPPKSPKRSARKGNSRKPVTKAPPKRAGSRFGWPVKGPLLSSYGPKKSGLHNDGINIKAPKGAPVRAAENGVVVYSGDQLKGYGNLVLVRHENRWMTAYAHMDKIMIRRGQSVKLGETIGTVGSTGSVDRPQLHFEVRRGTKAINPKRYLE
jgi:murein DD-endopeptidase MepM/ murein hydrolase activator NlpD